MKKQHIIFAFFAALMALTATSCQKDQELVTLTAVIQNTDSESKVYLNGLTPSWFNGDQIQIDNAVYTIQAVSGNSAQIPGVAATTGVDGVYRAFYPASMLPDGADITIVPLDGTNASRYFYGTMPAEQLYEVVGDYQRVELPMAALTSSQVDYLLEFQNIASVLRVIVSNPSTSAPLPVESITITASSAYLSGDFSAFVRPRQTLSLTMQTGTDYTHSHSVTLRKSDGTPMKTIQPGLSDIFDVVLPSFTSANDITIRVSTCDGYKEVTFQDKTLSKNNLVTATVTVDQLTEVPTAYLTNGVEFSRILINSQTSIQFHYNSTETSNIRVDADPSSSSSIPIYVIHDNDNQTTTIATPASRICANEDCSEMFIPSIYGNVTSQLTSIDFGTGFNTDNVRDMGSMFSGLINLQSLDLSSFNTTNVESMSSMFKNCSSLQTLDLSNFHTDNLYNMGSMFYGCTNLQNLSIPNFYTRHVTDMSDLFYSCSNLTSLDLSHFDTRHVADMSGMFRECRLLSGLNISNFDTRSVTDMSYMFSNCRALTSLDLSNFNTSEVTNMSYMFHDCQGFQTITGTSSTTGNNVLNLSSFNTSEVTTMEYMFSACTGLQTVNFDNFVNTEVQDFDHMFYFCTRLQTASFPTTFCTSNARDLSEMFSQCTTLTSLTVLGWDVTGVTTMENMFRSCSSIQTINLSSWHTSSTTACGNMFVHCTGCAVLYLNNFAGPASATPTPSNYVNMLQNLAQNYNGTPTIYCRNSLKNNVFLNDEAGSRCPTATFVSTGD